MVISKRERNVAILTVVALGAFGLNQLWEYYAGEREQITSSMSTVEGKLNDINALFGKQRRLEKVWKEMQTGGLTSDRAEAETRISHAIAEWSRDSGMNLIIMNATRRQAENGFIESGYDATATGPMATVAQMLWRIETSTIPIRIEKIEITPLKPGIDNLQLVVSLSTLSRDQTAPANGRPGNTTADARPILSNPADAKGARL